MKDPEYLREVYNKRFREPVNKWGSEDPDKCLKIARKVVSWTKIKPENNPKMLDVGCGTGFYTRAFSKCGFEAYGLDYSDVAVAKSAELHPGCHFIHMDGFNPVFDMKFDLIFCRGFSGCNTHKIEEVTEWSDKYLSFLNAGGKFVLSYSSDFSGKEAEGETVNWSKKEIDEYRKQLKAKFSGIYFFYKNGLISRAYFLLKKITSRKKIKQYYYLIFTKE